jgi:hypothetical protein
MTYPYLYYLDRLSKIAFYFQQKLYTQLSTCNIVDSCLNVQCLYGIKGTGMFSRKDGEIVNSADTFSSEETLTREPTTKRHVL